MEMKVQDVVGHADWGLYTSALSLGFLFVTLADLGINYYATKTLSSQPELLRSYFPQLLSVKLAITVIYPVLMVMVAWALGYELRHLYMLAILCLVQGGAQVVEFFRANYRAMQRFQWDSIMSVFDRAVLLVAVGGLFLIGLSVERFIYARLGAIWLAVAVSYALLTRMYGWMRPQIDFGLIKKLVRMSLPFAAMTVLYSIHDKVDQVMLQRMAGDVPTGLYAGAYRWMDAFSMFLWTVLPIFFARFSFFLNDRAKKEELLHFGQAITGVPMSFVCIFGLFYGEKLLFPYANSSPEELAIMLSCLQALFLALLINGNFAVFSTLLTSTGHERYVNWLVGISIVLNVSLNLIFIPTYGAVACAWSTLASYILMCLAYVVYIQLRMPEAIPYSQLLKIAFTTTLLAGSFWALEQTGLPWWVNTAIAGIGYLLLVRLLGILTLEKLKSIRVGGPEA